MKSLLALVVLIASLQASFQASADVENQKMPTSIQPVRMARVHGFIQKTTFGSDVGKWKTEDVCVIDTTIPVYDLLGVQGSSSVPRFADCKTTLGGNKAEIVVIGSVTLDRANRTGPESKNVGYTLFVGVPAKPSLNSDNSFGAGSEDLAVQTLKASINVGRMFNPGTPTKNNEMFSAFLTVEDKQ